MSSKLEERLRLAFDRHAKLEELAGMHIFSPFAIGQTSQQDVTARRSKPAPKKAGQVGRRVGIS